MIFLLKCPKCSHTMKYQTHSLVSEKKRKKCVYCGFSMSAGKCIIKRVQ
ncbi:hypothetical protein HYX01_03990 [Candidatus Woesearchaeota archaeon]|nr:hypothetical protein [Candidatus Woesearchaeota archaeon]